MQSEWLAEDGFALAAMTESRIPLSAIGRSCTARVPDAVASSAPPTHAERASAPERAEGAPLLDRFDRPLRDLRISVTDRCNFRCSYCMPKEAFGKDHPFLPHSALLTFEEITRLARLFVAQGVRKIRLTGGEPLLRKNIEGLVAQLAALRTPDGQALDLTLTTNGSLLARKARALREAGLRRITVSLDALDDAVFCRMNDVNFPVADVLEGIAAARAVGLGPVKVNMVVKRGVNEQEILPMARHFRGSGVTLRLIEYMDVGATNGWRMDEVLPSDEVLRRIAAQYPLIPLEPSTPGETAQRWAYADGAGEIGFISSVTQAFCRHCNRARLSTEGRVYLCLFANDGADLRPLLRERGASDEAIAAVIARLWHARADRYSELRGSAQAPCDGGGPLDAGNGARRVEMSYIGG
ncbi:MAG: GTP 3',8-cyclase MoaA [Burkholderiaceae bacterium]|nr:GTP 3',8-cyclase MoaA [Burkholderiaceae bacterium]